jgi:exodeoxyribonuclease V alpha subunit
MRYRTDETVALKGEVHTWREVREGWGYGELRVDGEYVACTGKLLARIGDTVDVRGRWVESERFGKQFKVTQCTVARPESTDGIVAWLASTLPDVGETRARALVDRFGKRLWDVIEHRPDELGAVSGITPARIAAICVAYVKHRDDRDDMIKLRGWGLTDNQITKCLQAWGTIRAVVDRVHSNPYELCLYVYGFGFLRADKVAAKAGVSHEAPARIAAGVEHVLDEAAGAGHCFMSGAALQKIAAKLLQVDPSLVGTAIIAAAAGGRVVRRGWRVFPRRLDDAEARCAAALTRMLTQPARGAAGTNVINLAERRAAAGKG